MAKKFAAFGKGDVIKIIIKQTSRLFNERGYLFMNHSRIAFALGSINDRFFKEAIAYVSRKKFARLKYAGIAVCAIIVFSATIITCFSLFGSHATDMYRQGVCFKVNDMRVISEISEKPILAERLILDGANYSQIELWYNENGSTNAANTWYSLITSGKFNDYEFVMYSLFEGDIDDWKVKTIFTNKSTRTVNINGVTVLTAPHTVSLDYSFYDYAIFEYDDVIYDLRVQSNSESTLCDLLNEIIPNLDN